ncbi:MAG: tape measure protein [Pseudomonadota bacterium]
MTDMNVSIKLKATAEGADKIRATADEIEALGGSAQDVRGQAAAMAESLQKIAAQEQLVTTFKQLDAELKSTAGNLDAARARVATLEASMASAEKPTAKMSRELDKARSTAGQLERAFMQQAAALNQHKSKMDSAGLSTSNLGAAQSRLKQQSDQVRASLTKLADQAQSRLAAAQLKAADSADKEAMAIRAMVSQARQAEALDQLKRRQLETAHSADQAAASVERMGNTGSAVMTKLAGVAAGVVGGFQFKQLVAEMINVGAQFETLGAQLETLYGNSRDAQAGLDWIKDFTKDTPFELAQVTEGFIKLKAMGMAPMDGTFQAIADQAAALGASGETLQGIVLALGQAWAKQKLQGEEAMQLLERGVPVWDLLAKAMGKTTAELMKMSEQGKLGRDVIRQLVDEMGRMNAGAAERAMQTFNGQISNLRDNWAGFLATIADSGALDYLKDQIASVNAAIAEMSETGELKAWATDVSNALVTIGNTLKGGALLIHDYAGALTLLAQVALGLKLGGVVMNLLGISKALPGIASGAGVAAGALGALGRAVPALAFAHLAIEVARATQAMMEYRAIKAQADAAAGRATQIEVDLQARLTRQIEAGAAAAETQIATREQLARMSADEAATYLDALVKARDYWNARAVASGRDAGAMAEANARTSAYAEAIATASGRAKDLAAAQREAQAEAERLKTPFADQADTFVRGAIQAKAYADQVRDSMAEVKAAAEQAAVSTGKPADVLAELGKKTAAELAAMADAWRKAYDGMQVESEEFARVNDQILSASFQKLGLTAETALGRISPAAGEAISSLDGIRTAVADAADSGAAKMEALGLAIKAAVSRADTMAALEAIKGRIESMGKSGELAGKALTDALDEVKRKLDDLKPGINSVEEAYRRLGVTSQAEIRKQIDALREAYDVIRQGNQPIEDQRQAWLAWAQAAVQSKDPVVQAQIEVEAATLGLNNELSRLAGQQKIVGDAARGAAVALRDQASATDQVAASSETASASASRAAGAVAQSANSIGVSWKGMAQQWGISSDLIAQYGSEMQIAFDRATSSANAFLALGFGSNGRPAVVDEMEAAAAAAQSVDQAIERLRSGVATMADLRYATMLAGQEVAVLGDQQLGGLRTAIADAERRMQELGDQSRSILTDLQDELDQMHGNLDEIEQRRASQRVSDIEARLAEARVAGNQQAVRDLEHALQLQKQINAERIQEARLREQEAARSRTATETTRTTPQPPATQTVKTVNVNIGGKTVKVLAGSEDDLLEALENAGLRS